MKPQERGALLLCASGESKQPSVSPKPRPVLVVGASLAIRSRLQYSGWYRCNDVNTPKISADSESIPQAAKHIFRWRKSADSKETKPQKE